MGDTVFFFGLIEEIDDKEHNCVFRVDENRMIDDLEKKTRYCPAELPLRN